MTFYATRFNTKYTAWRRYVRLCEQQGKHPASTLNQFVQHYIEQHKDQQPNTDAER